jgi:hypothetical protein
MLVIAKPVGKKSLGTEQVVRKKVARELKSLRLADRNALPPKDPYPNCCKCCYTW